MEDPMVDEVLDPDQQARMRALEAARRVLASTTLISSQVSVTVWDLISAAEYILHGRTLDTDELANDDDDDEPAREPIRLAPEPLGMGVHEDMTEPGVQPDDVGDGYDPR
jgi:hypothetical protein